MKYNSIREYFYKMHNVLYLLILFPLLAFIVLYWQIMEGNLEAPFYGDEEFNTMLLISMGVILFSDWVVSFFVVSKRIRTMRRIQSLGARLDQYYSLTIMRFAMVLSGSIVLAVGFYLTENQFFTMAAVSNLILVMFLWPLPSKVCRDLELKGDERTLVFFKKDKLH